MDEKTNDYKARIGFGSVGLLNAYGDNTLKLLCPRCHSVMLPLCFTSMPAQYGAECRMCSFSVQPWDRKNPFDLLGQGEVSEIYNQKDHTIGDRVG